jgi:ribonuclease HI
MSEATPPDGVGQDPVVIYSDGGCIGNPGPGGWGVVLLWQGRRKEISGGYKLTTNNRMELMGAIAGLEALKNPGHKVKLHSDSQYVVKAMEEGWARSWKRMGWIKKDKKPALNPDLWERLLDLASRHRVTFHWVKGHNGDVENERCDVLANTAARQSGLPADPGYP